MKTIVFVCVENSCRSQMAEAFARRYGANKVQVYSAGSKASGVVNPKAIELMKEVGYDLSKHTSKSIKELPQLRFDILVSMGCGDKCPVVPAVERLEWNTPDPKNLSLEEFRVVRDLIEEQVKVLIDRL